MTDYATNWYIRSECSTALLTPRTFDNVTNYNALYDEMMKGKKPEIEPAYATLDPNICSEQAREWALHHSNNWIRENQQSAWQSTRTTNAMAPNVLEEIVKSWDKQPPAIWRQNPIYEQLDRQRLPQIIEEKRINNSSGSA